MISEILFYGIGIMAIYISYKIIKKQWKKGKCAGCPAGEMCKGCPVNKK